MRVSVIMGVAGNFKDRLSPLEDLLRTILSATEDTDQSGVLTQYVELCDTMIDGLVDASDFPGFVRSYSLPIVSSAHFYRLYQTALKQFISLPAPTQQ